MESSKAQFVGCVLPPAVAVVVASVMREKDLWLEGFPEVITAPLEPTGWTIQLRIGGHSTQPQKITNGDIAALTEMYRHKRQECGISGLIEEMLEELVDQRREENCSTTNN